MLWLKAMRRWGSRILLVSLTLQLLMSTNSIAAELGKEEPEHVVMGLVDDPRYSVALAWRTKPSITGTVVEYWPIAEPDNTTSAVGQSMAWRTDLGEMRIHRVQVGGLQPGVTYGYRVGDGSEGRWSPANQFTTAPNRSSDQVSILVLSDTQSSPGRYSVWGDTLYWALTDQHPEHLLVLPGDIVDYGGDQSEWEQWFAAVRSQGLGKLPVLPVIGNHELSVGGRGKNNGEPVLMQFQTPSNGPAAQRGLVYSVDYGDVHIVIQNSEARSSSDIETQKRFLIEDLSKSEARWRVVFMHRPPYESVRSWSNAYLEAYIPIWEQYGVDLVVTGHDHVYMRTYPMLGGKMATEQPLDLNAGIVYVTAGRAGSKGAPSDIYQPEQAALYRRLTGPNYVYLMFGEDELRIVSMYSSWGVIDDVTLKK